jgi:hypothetical protein
MSSLSLRVTCDFFHLTLLLFFGGVTFLFLVFISFFIFSLFLLLLLFVRRVYSFYILYLRYTAQACLARFMAVFFLSFLLRTPSFSLFSASIVLCTALISSLFSFISLFSSVSVIESS